MRKRASMTNLFMTVNEQTAARGACGVLVLSCGPCVPNTALSLWCAGLPPLISSCATCCSSLVLIIERSSSHGAAGAAVRATRIASLNATTSLLMHMRR